MLKHIQIENFALIDSLELELESGLTMITGETGAGKSILLGALGLILGNRADLSAIRDTSRKCIVDAQFDISKLDLKPLFEESDLDYDHLSFLRREILPSGKSRAFINDTPVNLQVMNRIGARLIDIHSQHQTLQLAKDVFQTDVLNSFVLEATKGKENSFAYFLHKYQEELLVFKTAQKELKVLELKGIEFSKELDYNNFLLQELDEANLDQVNQNDLEEENEQLSNVEGITEVFTEFDSVVSSDDQGILDQLRSLQSKFQSISNYSKTYESLKDRISSILLELEDIHQEVVHEMDAIESDPERLNQINDLLSLLENLYRKHQVDEVEKLILIRDELADKVFESQGLDKKIKKQETIIAEAKKNLQKLGKELTTLRIAHKSNLEQEVVTIVNQLGMPDAQFKVEITSLDTFGPVGVDDIKFVFTANKGSQLLALDKAASGGELSRLMLAIKSILSRCKKLPTIIFDEIDTGVSGAIATQMAQIMKLMSREMQVMAITHLPQIAASGKDHLIVKKTSDNSKTYTSIERLDPAARLEEIAQMLSGGEISNAARENARALLN
ncbi:DNA repair protein RecN (Recombination protein N) [Nonlabens dokdonensis]|uniref:DNA repair protein RecN n=2 Tax=Nonlabens dokdonensis TaxID=328515 RepID=L7WFI9_NONDD|nr:DNA repair protein RecN [Nonlabens dokdonensis]AGC78721.1 DNA repair protein RecN [Nonlabens dokdonensis DSW-6]PZX39152.1 DNA repair protein RecN (Recombination protein N) [Nonlabens dokdonensis]